MFIETTTVIALTLFSKMIISLFFLTIAIFLMGLLYWIPPESAANNKGMQIRPPQLLAEVGMHIDRSKDIHGQWCKEWAIIAVVTALWITPVTRNYLISIMGNGLVKSALAFTFLAVLGRKMQVWAWESGFDDGGDAIPDPRLYDSGDGNGKGLRAFMPGVIRASWCTPLSRILGMSKRKVGVLLPDGSVSFPVWPVAAISAPGTADNWMPVPDDWCITADQASKILIKREKIKKKERLLWKAHEEDFMAFTDLIFGSQAVIGVGDPDVSCEGLVCTSDYQADENLVRLVRLERLHGENSQRILRDFNNIFKKQTELMAISEKLFTWEKKRPVALSKVRARVTRLEEMLEKYTAPGA